MSFIIYFTITFSIATRCVCKNWALGKPATQSSTYRQGYAYWAVDGVNSTYYNSQYRCTHTIPGDVLPWWRVDLQESVLVTAVGILNRGDCCGQRLRLFSILIQTTVSGVYRRKCFSRYKPLPAGVYTLIRCKRRHKGRYVKILKYRQYLTLCEVSVMGYKSADGGWGTWVIDREGKCDVSCGAGRRGLVYKRYCNRPKPRFRGKSCIGSAGIVRFKACDTAILCPIPGAWGPWQIVIKGACDVTCEIGRKKMMYTRKCDNPKPQNGGKTCSGEMVKFESRECDTGIGCPVDGGWNSWTLYYNESCSSTCIGGTEKYIHTRACVNPKPQHGGKQCYGNDTRIETNRCNIRIKCPVDGGWTSWMKSKQGVCSVSCGGYGWIQLWQSRDCTNPSPMFGGILCQGRPRRTVTKACYKDCPIQGTWSTWKKEDTGLCDEFCKRVVRLCRDCLSPTNITDLEVVCPGGNVTNVTQTCNWGLCALLLGQAGLDQESSAIVSVLAILIVVIPVVYIVFFVRKVRLPKSKMQYVLRMSQNIKKRLRKVFVREKNPEQDSEDKIINKSASLNEEVEDTFNENDNPAFSEPEP